MRCQSFYNSLDELQLLKKAVLYIQFIEKHIAIDRDWKKRAVFSRNPVNLQENGGLFEKYLSFGQRLLLTKIYRKVQACYGAI